MKQPSGLAQLNVQPRGRNGLCISRRPLHIGEVRYGDAVRGAADIQHALICDAASYECPRSKSNVGALAIEVIFDSECFVKRISQYGR